MLLKKEAFLAVGMFPELRLHQDTVLIYKLSLMRTLEGGGGDDPVAQRFIHNDNRILNDNTDFMKTRRLLFEDLLKWVRKYKQDIGKYEIFKRSLVGSKFPWALSEILTKASGKIRRIIKP